MLKSLIAGTIYADTVALESVFRGRQKGYISAFRTLTSLGVAFEREGGKVGAWHLSPSGNFDNDEIYDAADSVWSSPALFSEDFYIIKQLFINYARLSAKF